MAFFKKLNKYGSKKVPMNLLWLVFLVLSLVFGLMLVKQKQDVREKASGVNVAPCKSITTKPSDCNNTCSPAKSGKNYQCKWLTNQGCVESSATCVVPVTGGGGNPPPPPSNEECSGLTANGSSCSYDSECCSGYCDVFSGYCRPPGTETGYGGGGSGGGTSGGGGGQNPECEYIDKTRYDTQTQTCLVGSQDGIQTRKCTSNDTWGPWGACLVNNTGSGSGSGTTCTKGQTRRLSCTTLTGKAGYQPQTCKGTPLQSSTETKWFNDVWPPCVAY